jgi:hypothetical protein
MKVRQGFVSNSSTSSYIVVTTKETFDKTMVASEAYVQAVMRDLSEEFALAGMKMVCIAYYSGMGGEGNMDYAGVDYKGERTMSPYDAYETFMSNAKKNGEVFHTSIGG